MTSLVTRQVVGETPDALDCLRMDPRFMFCLHFHFLQRERSVRQILSSFEVIWKELSMPLITITPKPDPISTILDRLHSKQSFRRENSKFSIEFSGVLHVFPSKSSTNHIRKFTNSVLTTKGPQLSAVEVACRFTLNCKSHDFKGASQVFSWSV